MPNASEILFVNSAFAKTDRLLVNFRFAKVH